MGEKPMGREDSDAGTDQDDVGAVAGHFEAVLTAPEAKKAAEPPKEAEAKREADLADAEELDPLTGASGVNTTRSNIKSSASAQIEGGPEGGDLAGRGGDPVPDIDV